jgi:hypothetical protein
VSILAVIISIRTARLPYKKKILVVSGSYISSDGMGLHITVTNVGNRNIKIKTIGFLLGNLVYINKNTLMESQVMLMQGEITSQYFNIDDLKAKIMDSKISTSIIIRAFMEDTEGKRYKRRLIKAGKLIKIVT